MVTASPTRNTARDRVSIAKTSLSQTRTGDTSVREDHGQKGVEPRVGQRKDGKGESKG